MNADEILWLAQVRAKTFVAVGHETANKGEGGKNLRRDTMDANLLANMELGVHADAAPGRQTSDLVRACSEFWRTGWFCRSSIQSAGQLTVTGVSD